MSLDVWLCLECKIVDSVSKIFVRENGQNREIARSEWDERFPGLEPVAVEIKDPEEVFEWNITHNLAKMADQAGLYECLWRPDENEIEKASQLIEPLKKGLDSLKSDPNRFKKLNPENGWGSYEGLVSFVENYLKACEKYPDAMIGVSR